MAPFWKIKSCKEAPSLPYGYLVMMALAIIPSLFDKVMIPKIRNWDTEFANDEERNLAQEANRKAGWNSEYLL